VENWRKIIGGTIIYFVGSVVFIFLFIGRRQSTVGVTGLREGGDVRGYHNSDDDT